MRDGEKAMTDLIALAKQAGGIVDFADTTFVDFSIPALQAFADLIRKDEREQCAVVAEKTICDTHIPTGIAIYGTRAGKAIRARTTT